MSSSFPKPARRRSGHDGGQKSDNRSDRSGVVPRQRRPASPARRTRVEKDLGWTTGSDFGMNAGEPRSVDHDVPHGGEERPTSPQGVFPGQGHKRGGNQEAPVLPGIKPVLELLQATPERVDAVFLRKGRHGKDMERIVDLCRASGVRFSLLEPASFARVYEGHSQGVVARLFEAGFADLDTLLANVMESPLPLVLVLDQVQDPGNAGTLARTLYALGGAGLVAPRHNGVYLGAAAAKAAAGALDKLPVSKVANLGQAVDSAKKYGFTIYGAASGYESEESEQRSGGPRRVEAALRESADKRIPVEDNILSNRRPVTDVFSLAPRLPAMLILGSEEGGMRSNMEKRCDRLLRIPMLRDFDSLNVAQAGAIIIGWFAHCATRKANEAPPE